MKLKITLQDWDSHCGDGCCSDYGTRLYLNDELLDHPDDKLMHNGYIGMDVSTALRAVLNKLGYEVEIEEI